MECRRGRGLSTVRARLVQLSMVVCQRRGRPSLSVEVCKHHNVTQAASWSIARHGQQHHSVTCAPLLVAAVALSPLWPQMPQPWLPLLMLKTDTEIAPTHAACVCMPLTAHLHSYPNLRSSVPPCSPVPAAVAPSPSCPQMPQPWLPLVHRCHPPLYVHCNTSALSPAAAAAAVALSRSCPQMPQPLLPLLRMRSKLCGWATPLCWCRWRG